MQSAPLAVGKIRTQKLWVQHPCHCEAIPDEKYGLAIGQPEIQIEIFL